MTDRVVLRLELVERTDETTGTVTRVVRSAPYFVSEMSEADKGVAMLLLTEFAWTILASSPIYVDRLESQA